MKIIKKSLPIVVSGAMSLALSGCIDETDPINYITPEQVEAMTSSQEAMLNGIIAFTNDLNTYGGTGDYAYYLNDYGYPCQMFYRDVLTADFPLHDGAGYAYWQYSEQSLNLNSESTYTYNYYYQFINNCNSLIKQINPETASATSLHYLGCALTFRALCYFDMARLFEYQNTGYATFDDKANDVKGLTVTIADENSTETELRNKARAPFYTMYRFILTDLTNAAKYLEGYSRPDTNHPDVSVVYGLMARFWLEVATRFNNAPEDLTTQLSHESDNDGYVGLGISTANDCYANASKYARLAESGYTPMTEDQWTDPNTGFNTANSAYMLCCSISAMEQEGYYYSNWSGSICTEATWGMPQIGNCYREIGSYLYGKIGSKDWRKKSWIDPNDAGKAPGTKYRLQEWTEDTVSYTDKFTSYPAYANLKMRPRSATDYITGMYSDTPMMRVEEMYFIDAEATAHTDGVSAGVAKLQTFMNTYRYTNNGYKCSASTFNAFNTEMLIQKRIEFWGEGLIFFDMKRLKQPVLRSLSTNYGDAYKQDSKDGYVCPTMNLFIPEYAKELNVGLVLNPDCTGWQDL